MMQAISGAELAEAAAKKVDGGITCGEAVSAFLRRFSVLKEATKAINESNALRVLARHYGLNFEVVVALAHQQLTTMQMVDQDPE